LEISFLHLSPSEDHNRRYPKTSYVIFSDIFADWMTFFFFVLYFTSKFCTVEDKLPKVPTGISISERAPLPRLPFTSSIKERPDDPTKRGHDTREFLRILEDYPVLWQHKYSDGLESAQAIDKAATAMLKRYTIKKYDKQELLTRYSRERSHLMGTIKKYATSGDDVLYDKLSKSVFPNYLIHYMNDTYKLRLSKEVIFSFFLVLTFKTERYSS
jgi:hypothetical protein